jgi:hypothetical protein
VASSGRNSPSSAFPNCPWPQLSASHISQLQLSTDSTSHWTTSSRYTVLARTAQKTSLLLLCVFSLLGKQHVHSSYLAVDLHVTVRFWWRMITHLVQIEDCTSSAGRCSPSFLLRKCFYIFHVRIAAAVTFKYVLHVGCHFCYIIFSSYF